MTIYGSLLRHGVRHRRELAFEFRRVDQDKHAAGEAPDVRQGQVRGIRDLLEEVLA
jgi:hypothetical protein